MICTCDLATKLVGDGCEACNPKLALEYAKQTIEEKDTSIKELVEALNICVLEYEIWAKAVQQIIGRTPETGIHLELAKELLAKYKTPSE